MGAPLFSIIRAFNRQAERWLRLFLMSSVAVLIVVIAWQVFGRYVLNDSPSWSEEVARLLLVWFTFLGAPLITRYCQDVRVNYFFDHLFSERFRFIVEILVYALVIGFTLFLAHAGMKHVIKDWHVLTSGMKFPMASFLFPVPFGAFLTFLFALENLVLMLREHRESGHV